MVDSNSIIIGTFALYLLAVLGIGVWAASKTDSQSDFLLGGRDLNVVWATLSEQASLWSGWLTVGFPAQVYSAGIGGMWWFFWCIPGNLLAWGVIAKRLSRYSRMLKALTLPEFLGRRYEKKYTSVILLAALGSTYFYFFYVGAQILAGQAAIQSGLGFSGIVAFLLTVIIVVGYTVVGGYLAVSLTDVIQGIFMMIFAIVVPLATIAEFGGYTNLVNQFTQATSTDMHSWTAGESGIGLGLSIVALIGFGLPFLAQPHGVVRYMSLRKPSSIGYGMLVMAIFQVIALIGIPVLAFGGLLMFPDLANVDNLAPLMIIETLPPWLAGILLSAIVAAVMSTADSQLLVVASSIGEDAYKGVINPNASDSQVLWITRAAVLVAGAVATYIAWTTPETVFTAIAFAWGGLATMFIPPVILGLWWKRANGPGALAGMIVGFLGAAVWSQYLSGGPVLGGTGLFDYYFVTPVLIISMGTMILVSLLTEPPKDSVDDQLREISQPLTEEITHRREAKDSGPVTADGGSSTESLALMEESIVTEFVQDRAFTEFPAAVEEIEN